MTALPISVIIPTYRRGPLLLRTIELLLRERPAELLIVDQTPDPDPEVTATLLRLEREGLLRWLRLPCPSIPHALNVGVLNATQEVVLVLDDDIVPGPELLAAHLQAHECGARVVVGQILQPGEVAAPLEPGEPFRFSSSTPSEIEDVMAGNLSFRRELFLRVGGFDENFVRVAYRFESEFADRVIAAGERILFEPRARLDHLKEPRGGTRSYGEHLTTWQPSHSVGSYYYHLVSARRTHRVANILRTPLRAIRTRHHLARPWWIPVTLTAEALGLAWAVGLWARGPRRVGSS